MWGRDLNLAKSNLNPNSAPTKGGIGKYVGEEGLESSISTLQTWLIGSTFWLAASHLTWFHSIQEQPDFLH